MSLTGSRRSFAVDPGLRRLRPGLTETAFQAEESWGCCEDAGSRRLAERRVCLDRLEHVANIVDGKQPAEAALVPIQAADAAVDERLQDRLGAFFEERFLQQPELHPLDAEADRRIEARHLPPRLILGV